MYNVSNQELSLIDERRTAGGSAERCAVITFDHEWDGNYAADFSSQSEVPFKGLNAIFTFDHPVSSVSVSINQHHIYPYASFGHNFQP